MKIFYERMPKLIHTELQSQDLDTLTYKDIRNLSRNAPPTASSPNRYWRNSNIKCYTSVKSSKEQFLLFNDLEKNFVIFSCTTNLQFLSSIDVLYVDGTFRSTRKFFHQLLTIHGLSNGHYKPLAFFLLANKHQISYEDVLRHTVSEAAELGVNVFPSTLYADFETPVTKQW